MSYIYLKHWLAISRTRIFVAVVVPCLIGSAVALEHGYFAWTPFMLMLFGLVMVESANLFTADWTTYRGKGFLGGDIPPIIEGSPTIPEKILPLRYSIHAAMLCFTLATLILSYFALHLGFMIILLGVLAVAIGSFYVFSPIKYGFFSTALLPPIIAFAAYYVLVGLPSWEPIIVSLPMMIISSGVIFTYRVLYSDKNNGQFHTYRKMLIGIYSSSYIMLMIIVLLGFVPILATLSFLTLPILIVIIKRIELENSDYMPATSLGVLIYFVTGILIALSYILI